MEQVNTLACGSLVARKSGYDGYINATELCKAAGKNVLGYIRKRSTKDFLEALADEQRIPASELMQRRNGNRRGIWIHPGIAPHFAKWLKPGDTAWLAGLLANRSRVLHGHFSALELVTAGFVVPMIVSGVPLRDDHRLDKSWEANWGTHLSSSGYSMASLPTYSHPERDGCGLIRVYPNSLFAAARAWTELVYFPHFAAAHFRRKNKALAAGWCDGRWLASAFAAR